MDLVIDTNLIKIRILNKKKLKTKNNKIHENINFQELF
jgi:hypothetical protein